MARGHDIRLIAVSATALHQLVTKDDQALAAYWPFISTPKTKVLTNARTSQSLNIVYRGEIREQVGRFKYLDVQISTNGDCKDEVRARLRNVSLCLRGPDAELEGSSCFQVHEVASFPLIGTVRDHLQGRGMDTDGGLAQTPGGFRDVRIPENYSCWQMGATH